MTLDELQRSVAAKFEGNHPRTVRAAHFVALLRSGIDGLASMGVILRVEAMGLDDGEVRAGTPPDVLGSLDAAIKHVQGGVS